MYKPAAVFYCARCVLVKAAVIVLVHSMTSEGCPENLKETSVM